MLGVCYVVIYVIQVCMYEFMTGMPPFCDETVEKIFENILSYSLEWPEGSEALSPEAVCCISSLLCQDPVNRSNRERLHRHPLFKVRQCWITYCIAYLYYSIYDIVSYHLNGYDITTIICIS